MSYGATRYQPKNRHHIPPRNPDKYPRIIKVIEKRHHDAYHLLFGAAPNLEACIEILKRDWWPEQNIKRSS